MRTYKCRYCTFTFSEADKAWDSAIDSGRCPKCSETLFDFPVPVKSSLLSIDPQPTRTAMTSYKRMAYFVLVSIALAFLTAFLVDRMLGLLAARNWAIAALAFGIGWSLNNKAQRIALTRTPYLALCAVYFIVATILRALLVPAFEGGERDFFLLGLEILSAYVLTWIAIKTNKQKPMNA